MTSGPIEKKVAYPAAAMTAATVALGFIHYYAPAWQLPPVWLVTAALTVVWSVVGYFAPHTHLRPEPIPPPLTADEVAELTARLARPVVRVQPSASTGTQKGTSTP
jgi:hypothetical protein